MYYFLDYFSITRVVQVSLKTSCIRINCESFNKNTDISLDVMRITFGNMNFLMSTALRAISAASTGMLKCDQSLQSAESIIRIFTSKFQFISKAVFSESWSQKINSSCFHSRKLPWRIRKWDSRWVHNACLLSWHYAPK